ncbi:MAG: type IV pilus assembly protein PilM [Chitinivibrionales bacterium]|nr:type IV pilus assembly protein PilM [Chitinivibrionales bacterium]MBD3356897.1 type IV pilus assembly protein PilM [Chitinivibrionales bacterium]
MNVIQKLRGITATVGLDIGSHSIKLVKIRHGRKGESYLEATGIRELGAGTIEGGDIRDRDGLVEAVMTLINQCDPSTVEVVISMSGHGMLSDRFNFKVEAGDNTEEMILWEAGQRSPFDVEDITLDYKVLRTLPESNEIEVLLVAAKNQIMQNYIDLLYDAGLKPVIVDIDAFAVYNSYVLERGGHEEEGTVVLLNIGHDLTSITFLKDGLYHSTRDISTACRFFGATLIRNAPLGEDAAAEILRGEGDTAHDADVVRQSIEYAAEELSSGIELAFSYYRSSANSDRIDKMVLSGGGANIPGLVPFLESRHDTTVRISNPLAHLQYDPGLFGAVNPGKISPFLTVAVGLALRKVTD